MNTHQQKPITLLICALGGEGGGVLSEWLIDVARASGYPAQSTSIPGVAQRTGATTYYVEVFPVPMAELAGKRPVFSLYPAPGSLDAIVSSELLETARQIGNSMSAAERTLVITSSNRTLTTQERMQLGDGRTDTAPLLELVRTHSREHHVFDMGELARSSGTIVSAVMLGAIAGSGLFPFTRAAYEGVIEAGGKGTAASLRGFAKGFELVQGQQSQARLVQDLLSDSERLANNPPGLQPDFIQIFPLAVQDIVTLGHARLVEYQGAAYAQRYVERLQQVLQAERASDPAGARGYAITRETARWLALWMAFDDIVRVADLKSRARRWQRVLGEVKAGTHDLLKVYDHFKPGAPEFAALLPQGLAQRVLAWDRRRVARGKDSWALPLKIGTHSVGGMIALRLLASLKWLRPLGSRFATEQALIEQWLAAVVSTTRRHWQAGLEIAQCGRLIKGYGSTNERGKDNLLYVIEHLAAASSFASDEARAEAIAAARTAALADDAGQALDRTLVQHGVPARPVKAQPIRWVRNPRLNKTS
ncbi:MAG: indolepyruvate oxidoreductase subunit beta family protein [Hylemonella sp.]|nr:indolepyruvate oxidoreductase subunit beta family protein [Hylemonella sp.]MDP1937021.1 indolepyruvate oxidoreductase subunit beta family protein [Hylemonella sp.]